MKKGRNIDKFGVILAICDDDMAEALEDYLRSRKLTNGILFMGKGTAESEIADIFGFGMRDRVICATLVPEVIQEKELYELSEFLGIEKDRYGLAMLLGVSSSSSVVLDMLGINTL